MVLKLYPLCLSEPWLPGPGSPHSIQGRPLSILFLGFVSLMPPVSEISEMLPLGIFYFHLVQWFFCLLVHLFSAANGKAGFPVAAGWRVRLCLHKWFYIFTRFSLGACCLVESCRGIRVHTYACWDCPLLTPVFAQGREGRLPAHTL